MNSHSVKKNKKVKPLATELSSVPDSETQTSATAAPRKKRPSLPAALESVLEALSGTRDAHTATGITPPPSEEPQDLEVTEITVRVRPSSKKEIPVSLEFDIDAVRRIEAPAVKMSSLHKNYQDSQGSGRRASPRYRMRFTTIIYTKSQSFRTHTANVSMGGALLEDRLPKEFLYGTLEILFIYEDEATRQKQYFMFKGEGLEGPGEQSRLQFQSASQSVQDALTNLLAALGDKALVA